MTKNQLAKWDKMVIALRAAESEFIEMLSYANIEGSGAILSPGDIDSIRKVLMQVQEAQP